ncbi:MAG TPA: hypothetical protein VHS27_09335 [Gaiellales bacterium]|jgi:hypothetical protein|nr:hypothetical protein [Gaiellales bacterium]
MLIRRSIIVAAASALFVAAGPALADSHDTDLPNGGFEASTLAPWMTSSIGEGDSSWSVYTGTSAPISGLTVIAPPFGQQAAIADQNGPGSNVLYRTFRVDGDDGQLRLWVWYHNYAGAFFSPHSLFEKATGPQNQQLRIDILQPSAPLRTLRASAVLATPFRTQPGDATERGPFLVRVNVRGWHGRRIRLRIAEVDNQGNFDVVIDGVRMVDLAGRPD